MQFPNIYFNRYLSFYSTQTSNSCEKICFPVIIRYLFLLTKNTWIEEFGKVITNVYLRIIKYMRFYFNICGHK